MSPLSAAVKAAHMAEHLTMSQKERTRLGIMREIKGKEMTLVAAAKILRLCYRQMKRVWRRYQDQGDGGLVHRSRGRVSNRAKAGEFQTEGVGALCRALRGLWTDPWLVNI